MPVVSHDKRIALYNPGPRNFVLKKQLTTKYRTISTALFVRVNCEEDKTTELPFCGTHDLYNCICGQREKLLLNKLHKEKKQLDVYALGYKLLRK